MIGNIQMPTEGYRSRSTDFLSAHETGFIALTSAEIVRFDGGEPESHPFVAVGARHIHTLVEVEDLGVSEEDVKTGVQVTSPAPPTPAPAPTTTLSSTSTPPPGV